MSKRPRQKWTAEEAEALRAGVAKYGVANWKTILKDLEFAPKLHNRTNIDLKDKWRNNQIFPAQRGAGTDDSMTPKEKATSSSVVAPKETQNNSCIEDSVTKANYNFLECNAMIFEALTSLKDPRGSDFSAIAGFIEQRHVVPENFRKLLVSHLKKLVREEKVEKARRFYKIKDAALGTDTPTPEQKDVRPRPMQKSGQMTSRGPVDSAAEMAAIWVAKAENTDSRAAEAIDESERVSLMAEDAEAMFTLSKELYVHSTSSQPMNLRSRDIFQESLRRNLARYIV